jgi:membrane protein
MDQRDLKDEAALHEVARHFRMLAWLRKSQLLRLVKDTAQAWQEDKAPRLGAALAFYTALSLAPLILVVLAVAGLAFGEAAVQGELEWQARDMIGPHGAAAVQALVQAAHAPGHGVVATIVGLFALFFGATSVVVELTDALNTIWRVPPRPYTSGLAGIGRLMKQRFISFTMILGIGFLLLVSLVVSAWLAALGAFFRKALPIPHAAMEILNFILSFLVITFLFALIYKVLPDVRLRWSDVAVGAAVTSLLFTLGKFLIGLYLGNTTFASAYGAAGSFLIVLVWVYYSAQVFFLGAEFTKIYTHEFGSSLRATLELHPVSIEEPNRVTVSAS